MVFYSENGGSGLSALICGVIGILVKKSLFQGVMFVANRMRTEMASKDEARISANCKLFGGLVNWLVPREVKRAHRRHSVQCY